jgi:hypothetical protein
MLSSDATLLVQYPVVTLKRARSEERVFMWALHWFLIAEGLLKQPEYRRRKRTVVANSLDIEDIIPPGQQ